MDGNKVYPSRPGHEMLHAIIPIFSSLRVKNAVKIYEEPLEDDNAPKWKEPGFQDQ